MLPELRGQVIEELLDRVLNTGVPHIGTETQAQIDWHGDGVLRGIWFNLVCAPLQTQPGKTDGVLVIAFDVTEQVNARVHRETGLVIDPHTATAWAVADELHPGEPCVIVSTAHPAKFSEAVERATGVAAPLPDDLVGILEAPERIAGIAPDMGELADLLAEAFR